MLAAAWKLYSKHIAFVLFFNTQIRINVTCDQVVQNTEPNILLPAGYYGEGLNAIIVFAACYLPDSGCADYHYIMENLFL